MPAKALDRSQKEDAQRLKVQFNKWQDRQRLEGLSATQEEAASKLPFGQSALAQYIGGRIPLNVMAVVEFSDLFGCHPADISPALSEKIEKLLGRVSYHYTGVTGPTFWPFPSIPWERFSGLPTHQQAILEGELRNAMRNLSNDLKGNSARA